jgi:N-acyl homoserine lactone hydrolase
MTKHLASVQVLTPCLGFLLLCCAASHHQVEPSPLGAPAPLQKLLDVVDRPGPLTVETINAADWEVDRDGLINLNHATARAAGLKAGPEAIHIFFHVIRHPTKGLFLIDSGVEEALRKAPDTSVLKGLVANVMGRDKMKVHLTLAQFLAAQSQPVSGVFLTHLHVDHVLGLPDLPHGAKVYVGPGETDVSSFNHLFTRGVIDAALAKAAPLQAWRFQPEANGPFEAAIDIFGDGSLWALWVPGHTPGSTAYLARTATGSVLMVGDASHTAWGWSHDVEPGSFSHDQPRSAESLKRLRAFAAAHPSLDVRLGHQLAETPANVAK